MIQQNHPFFIGYFLVKLVYCGGLLYLIRNIS